MFSYDEYRNIIDDCLRHHKFCISNPEGERLSILKRLQYPQNNIELYQYRKCNERNFNNFKMNQVTLVHPKYFNDSFEIMPYLNLKRFY